MDYEQPKSDDETHDEGNIDDEQDAIPVRGRVAVVEDGEATRYFLLRSLRGQGYTVKGIEDGPSAIPLLRTFQPEVILLDVTLPGLSGFDVCKIIRHDPLLRSATVIILTARASVEDRMAGWSAGADDYLIKPCEMPEVLARVAAHMRHRVRASEQWMNPITRLPAPAALDEELLARLRHGDSFAACYADIDHFKSYNDRYGFQAGDALLAMTADLLREIVLELNDQAQTAGREPSALAGHLGSDDFVLITSLEQAISAGVMLAERFSQLAPSLYHNIDRSRGWIPGISREGQQQNFPLVKLTVATVIRHPSDLLTDNEHGAVAGIATELWRQLRDAAQNQQNN
jgi:diguanylate cyclase (GGDEF)-like protein